MATGAELAALYGNSNPGYNVFKDWAAKGAQHPTWSPSAEEAARAAGIPSHFWDKVVRSETTPWGEGLNYFAGDDIPDSVFNPAYWSFVQNYDAQHGGARTSSTAPGAPAPGQGPPGLPLVGFDRGPESSQTWAESQQQFQPPDPIANKLISTLVKKANQGVTGQMVAQMLSRGIERQAPPKRVPMPPAYGTASRRFIPG